MRGWGGEGRGEVDPRRPSARCGGGDGDRVRSGGGISVQTRGRGDQGRGEVDQRRPGARRGGGDGDQGRRRT